MTVKNIYPKNEKKGFMKVLVVEDDHVNSLMARKMIELLGHQAVLAWGGAEAIEIVKLEDINLILMDINMPAMDGIQTTKIIIESLPDKQIPVIAVTADSNTIQSGRHLEAGMKGYIMKPYKMEQLKEVIDRYSE